MLIYGLRLSTPRRPRRHKPAWTAGAGPAGGASVEALRLSLTRAGLLTCSSGLCARWV